MALPKELNNAHAQKYLDEAAPDCAKVLIEHGKGKRKRLQSSRQRACEYIIDHAIGKARQKVEHSGGIISYADVSRSATDLDKKPRDILADVEEIANKYKEGEASTKDADASPGD